MIPLDSPVLENGTPGSESGGEKRGNGEDRGTGTKRKPPENNYSPYLKQGAPFPDFTAYSRRSAGRILWEWNR